MDGRFIPRDEKERREWIADNLKHYTDSIEKWKFDAMEIRAELILTREKMAHLYLSTGNEEILSIMGDLFRVIEHVKSLS